MVQDVGGEFSSMTLFLNTPRKKHLPYISPQTFPMRSSSHPCLSSQPLPCCVTSPSTHSTGTIASYSYAHPPPSSPYWLLPASTVPSLPSTRTAEQGWGGQWHRAMGVKPCSSSRKSSTVPRETALARPEHLLPSLGFYLLSIEANCCGDLGLS